MKDGEGWWDQSMGRRAAAGWELKDYGSTRGNKLKMKRNPKERILIW